MLDVKWNFEFTWTDGVQVGLVDFRWNVKKRTLTLWNEARTQKVEATLAQERNEDDETSWKLTEICWTKGAKGWGRSRPRVQQYEQAPDLYRMIVSALDHLEDVEICSQIRFGDSIDSPQLQPTVFK